MTLESFKNAIPFLLIISFLAYRFYKLSQLKKRLPELNERGAQIIDVRSLSEYAQASNPHSINIPVSEISKKLDTIKNGVPLVLCCASGSRSSMAARMLKSKGYEVYNLGNWKNTL